jgi:hypothetical protein
MGSAGRGSGRGLDRRSGNPGGYYQTGEGLAGILWRMGQGVGSFLSRLFWQMSSHADYDRFKDKSVALEEEKKALENKMNALEKGREMNRLNS